ncbi:MAG TPA: caspase family protein [Xanthobacteraceae bacterium]
MYRILKSMLAALALLVVALAPPAGAEPTEKRMALVIGNGAYPTGALATPANDAGLIAQTLQAAGFDVVGARDLDEDSLRHAFRDFVDSASKAGPDTVVAVYFAGYGLQLEGENYLVPIDANIARDADVPVRAIRVSDYTHALAALHLKATFVILDAARASPFSVAGQPLAGGLALVEPEPGMLIAFNATPDTVAPESQDSYGPYAKALAEMIRAGGLAPADLFDRARLRVNEVTQGAQVPWDASKIEAPFVFFERGPDAPPPAASAAQTASVRSRPIRDLDARDAYLAALSRDTLDGYEDFLAAYPSDPMARRVRALIAARREAITWRRTYDADTREAFWTYLRRYPRGPHVADARRRLAQLAAAFDPPSQFAPIDYDVPPPPPDEVEYYERPVLAFDDPVFAFAPPPPPPVYFLEPPPPEFVVLEPPPPPFEAYILPVPVFVPVPVYVSAPAYVAPPPNPIIFNNIHNTVVINNTSNIVTITKPNGQVVATAPSQPPAARSVGNVPVPVHSVLTPALPPSVAPKAALINSRNPQAPGGNPATQAGIKGPGGSTTPPATGNKPLPTPPAATLSPPTGKLAPLTSDKKALPNPSAPNLAQPAADNKTLPNPPATKLTPLTSDKKAVPNPSVTNLAPPATDKKTLPNSPATKLAPLTSDKKALPNPSATNLAPPATDKKPLPNPAAAKLSPPPTDLKRPSSPPVIRQAAPPVVHQAPAAVVHQTPPPVVRQAPAVVHQAPPPPPVVHQAPAAVVHQAPPPPPVVHQAPAAVVRQVAPPPPPVVHQPPPPPVVRQVQAPPRPPAPAAAAAAKCPIVNGKPTCK